MGQQLHLIVVGKLKETELQTLEQDYFKRLKNPTLKIHELRSRSEDVQKEGQDILQKIQSLQKDHANMEIVALSERGQLFDSEKFSAWLQQQLDSTKTLVFVIAGAAGHSQHVLKLSHQELSLSPLTFPHKLARLLLIEQLYRAQTIREKHPYHK